ncbi:MAG TPA: hypothetical protein ENG36_01320, partial [Lentisphaerae bacterium]|nr:hypothetical protein [Lentisphaerota bacterium]
VLWQRALGLVFGNTVYATSTVLVAVMLGFAVGAMLFGGVARRSRNPLFLFGLVEIGIGLSALMVPAAFSSIRGLYRILYLHSGTFTGPLTLVRFSLSVAVLLLPTVLMGGTLPLLVEFYARDLQTFGRRVGLLYGFNTFGAVAGVLACTFLLLPWTGVPVTRMTAVAINFAAGLAALWMSRGCVRPAAPRLDAGDGHEKESPTARDRGWIWGLMAAALSGFLALGFEVAWYRAFIMVYGSTTYSFGSMLAVFLAGIGAGSLLAGRWLDRWPQHAFLMLGASSILIGVSSLIAIGRFDAEPEFLLRFLVRHDFRWSAMIASKMFITAKAMLVPALCFGFNFTAAARIVRRALFSSGAATAAVYATNTAGAVTGALLVGFALLPIAGLEQTLLFLSLGAFPLAVLAVEASVEKPLLRSAALVVVLAFLCLKMLHRDVWDRHLLAMGAYFSPWNYVEDGRVIIRDRAESEELLYYHDGLTATVSASKLPDETYYFSINGKVEADTTPRGMVVQRMIGHLPMLFHGSAKKVLNIGLGAGVTLGALGTYPVECLDTVEIEPVVTAVALIWRRFNHGVMLHPKLRTIWWDGRNYLFCTTNTYDVIASDPFEPVVGGAAQLFTVEHFRTARAHLNPGGIMCQWIPTYEMSERDYGCLVKTFVT